MDPDMDLGGSTGHNSTTVPGGIRGYLLQSAPHCSQVLISNSLHSAQILLCLLLLFHHQLLAPLSGVWSVWSVSGVVSGMLCIMSPGRGHLGHGMSHRPAQRLTGGHLRLACCPDANVLDWCLFCAQFLPGPPMCPKCGSSVSAYSC